MTFPHAAKGINKIFTAEILALIAFVFSGIATVGAVITANILANDSNADIAAAAIVLLVFGIIAGVLAIVSVIIKFIGIFNASRDERAFKSVIYLTLINLGVAILAACFSGIPFFNNLSNIVTDLVEFIVSLLIILGIGKLALQLNNPEIIQKCGTLFRLILWIGLLSLHEILFHLSSQSGGIRDYSDSEHPFHCPQRCTIHSLSFAFGKSEENAGRISYEKEKTQIIALPSGGSLHPAVPDNREPFPLALDDGVFHPDEPADALGRTRCRDER